MQNPLIVAHRGATQLAPENSLAAFAIAIEKGADAIEFDVHFTRDHQLVIHHDYYLGRTESGSGFLGDYSLAELQAFDIGSHFSDRFSGERMPTLRDVLELGKHKVRFEIELRCPTLLFLNCVLEDIRSAGVADDVEITSPHIPLLAKVKNFAPKIRTGLFFPSYPSWMTARLGQQHIIDWMILLDAQVVHLPYSMLNKEFIEALHLQHLIVHSGNLNEEREVEAAIRLGVDQFFTDALETAVRIRNTV